MSLVVMKNFRDLGFDPGPGFLRFSRHDNGLSGTLSKFVQGKPDGGRALKGGFAVAFGDARCAPLTARPPPGQGSASGLSRNRRVAPAA